MKTIVDKVEDWKHRHFLLNITSKEKLFLRIILNPKTKKMIIRCATYIKEEGEIEIEDISMARSYSSGQLLGVDKIKSTTRPISKN